MHNHEEEGVHRMIITYIKEKEGKKSNTLFIDFFLLKQQWMVILLHKVLRNRFILKKKSLYSNFIKWTEKSRELLANVHSDCFWSFFLSSKKSKRCEIQHQTRG